MTNEVNTTAVNPIYVQPQSLAPQVSDNFKKNLETELKINSIEIQIDFLKKQLQQPNFSQQEKNFMQEKLNDLQREFDSLRKANNIG